MWTCRRFLCFITVRVYRLPCHGQGHGLHRCSTTVSQPFDRGKTALWSHAVMTKQEPFGENRWEELRTEADGRREAGRRERALPNLSSTLYIIRQ
jgi:hypothetical protein